MKKAEIKLRKGQRYLVRGEEGDFPLTCKYYGVHPVQGHEHLSEHLFLITGNEDSGYYVSDEELPVRVEPYSRGREKQIEAEAREWLAHEDEMAWLTKLADQSYRHDRKGFGQGAEE